MDSINKFVNIERDVAYMVGFDKGEEKARKKEQTKFVANLLTQSDFSIQKVSELAGVSVEFVEEIKKKHAGKK